MENGYYLSLYAHIGPLAHLYRISLRHDQSMALWQKEGANVQLVRYWEFERSSGLKKHELSFYSADHAKNVINALLSECGLSLNDIREVWGTPGLDLPSGPELDNPEPGCPLHSLCHLFSGMLADSARFYQSKVLAFALDGGPDNVQDENARNKKFYWGAYDDHGKLKYFAVPSPGAFWSLMRLKYSMEEGSLMALGSAATAHFPQEKQLADEAPLVYDGRDFDQAYRWLEQLALAAEELSIDRIPEYDTRFSSRENQISMVVKVVQAASIQIVDKIIREALERLGQNAEEIDLCMTGGFALNCPTNSHLMQTFGFRSFSTCPCVSDSGIALGLGLYEFYAKLPYFRFALKNAYHGFRDERPVSSLQKGKWERYIQEISPFDPAQFVADITKEPLVWMDGSAEIGPRALGARSILGDPRNENTKDFLNRVKQRQWWRPLAPIILKEEQNQWFEAVFDSPYMLCTSMAWTDKAPQMPAVLHLDGSARIQTMSEEENPLLYNAIRTFFHVTGVPIICNTSLNDKGEPIVANFEECLNFALRKGFSVAYLTGKRIRLQNQSEYPASLPEPRKRLLFSPLTEGETEEAKKYWNPYDFTQEELDIYLNIPELRSYDIRKEKDVRQLKRILKQWQRLNHTLWRALLC